MASSSLSAGRRAPIIGAYPKMLVPFIVVVPGIIAAVLVPQLKEFKANGATAEAGGVDFNDTMPLLIGQLMPNGMLGVALAGLLAAFMAGMAANISAFNTVFSYDIWQTYVVKDKPDHYYLEVGRVVTVIATVIAIGTAFIASNYTNLMDYLQTLFSFFNAPLFGVFIVGLFWKRLSPTGAWVGLVLGTAAAVMLFVMSETGVYTLPGQGAAFVQAGAAFVVGSLSAVVITFFTESRVESELEGLVWSETETKLGDEPGTPWWQSVVKLGSGVMILTIILNLIFR
jgi:solute:Na+ symporter, SSS family